MESENTNCSPPSKWAFHEELDTKELGCGDLVMALFKFFNQLESGTIVKLKSLDAGDVMAWSRSTGNKMHAGQPPFFLIEKK